MLTSNIKKARVLIVDDSGTMRGLIRMVLEQDHRIEVIGEASSAQEARGLVKRKAPDVMTLDVEMPGINGLEFLRRLMRARPMPVVMFSSITSAGSAAAVEALSLGAIECVLKPGVGGSKSTLRTLPETVWAASKARVATTNNLHAHKNELGLSRWNGKMVLIGASTGGVEALEHVLSQMPHNCPPIFITQHMPEQFLAKFSERLNRRCKPAVRLARDGDEPSVGQVLIAPGGKTHLTLGSGSAFKTQIMEGPRKSGHRPSVDKMLLSAIEHAPRTVAVMLTGMGYDGAEGMAALRGAGAVCFAQDRESSVVFGMPKAAYEKGGVDRLLPLQKIPSAILKACTRAEG